MADVDAEDENKASVSDVHDAVVLDSRMPQSRAGCKDYHKNVWNREQAPFLLTWNWYLSLFLEKDLTIAVGATIILITRLVGGS